LRGVTVMDCISADSNPKPLENDNQWHCPACNKHVDALKTTELYRLPPVLAICLKRFRHYGTRSEKINVKIDFPIEDLPIQTVPG
jgi:ubiquitin C-terminal hydrolase